MACSTTVVLRRGTSGRVSNVAAAKHRHLPPCHALADESRDDAASAADAHTHTFPNKLRRKLQSPPVARRPPCNRTLFELFRSTFVRWRRRGLQTAKPTTAKRQKNGKAATHFHGTARERRRPARFVRERTNAQPAKRLRRRPGAGAVPVPGWRLRTGCAHGLVLRHARRSPAAVTVADSLGLGAAVSCALSFGVFGGCGLRRVRALESLFERAGGRIVVLYLYCRLTHKCDRKS